MHILAHTHTCVCTYIRLLDRKICLPKKQHADGLRAVQLIGSDLQPESEDEDVDEDEDEDEAEPANKASERLGVRVVQRAYMGC
jgi:hypothetical protein